MTVPITRAMHPANLAAIDPPRRDPEDVKFLALALIAEADPLVGSDEDLLILHPGAAFPSCAGPVPPRIK